MHIMEAAAQKTQNPRILFVQRLHPMCYWLAALCGVLLGPRVCAQAEAGTALRFNGTNSYVSIPHNAALNAYPLTITAWVKTLRNSAAVDGIVSKYPDASGNGYSINLRNGNLYAWYYRAVGSAVVVSP